MNERLSHALLLVLLLGHLFILSTHQRSRESRFEQVLLGTFGPIGHAVVDLSAGVEHFFSDLRLAGTLRRENFELRAEMDRLRLELVRLQGVDERLDLLSRSAAYTPPETGGVVVADVVWIDQESWLRTLVLYTGTAEPERNQPVVTDQGLVGRIIVPSGRYAKVLLLSDPSLVVSAMIVRTRQRGLLRGGEDMELENIPLLADIKIGDEVVTAGIDGVFPRGIPIGRIHQVEPGQGLFQRIRVRSEVDFTALDQVHVLTRLALPSQVRERLKTQDNE